MLAKDQDTSTLLFELTESRKRVLFFTILCFLVML